MFFRQWEKFQNTVNWMISYSEPLGHVHNDYQFEIMFWKCRSAIGYTQQKSMEKAKRAFEDILKVLPDDFYEYLNHKIFMHLGFFTTNKGIWTRHRNLLRCHGITVQNTIMVMH